MLFNKKSINLQVSSLSGTLNYRSGPGTTFAVLHSAPEGKSMGRTTGNAEKMPDGTWWQVVINGSGEIAWVRQDVTKFSIPKDSPNVDGDKVVQGLIKSDEQLYYSILRASALAQGLESKGQNVAKEKATLHTLLGRLSFRQTKIKESGLVKFQTGFLKKYNALVAKLKSWLGIGEPVTVTVVVVISAILGAGLAVAAYYVFKPDYDDSKKDLVVSANLEKALSTLAPTEAAAVKIDLEKQIDTAYNQGKTDQSFSSFFSIGKYILIAGIGFVLINKFVKKQK
jgi:hypothetical protein